MALPGGTFASTRLLPTLSIAFSSCSESVFIVSMTLPGSELGSTPFFSRCFLTCSFGCDIACALSIVGGRRGRISCVCLALSSRRRRQSQLLCSRPCVPEAGDAPLCPVQVRGLAERQECLLPPAGEREDLGEVGERIPMRAQQVR